MVNNAIALFIILLFYLVVSAGEVFSVPVQSVSLIARIFIFGFLSLQYVAVGISTAVCIVQSAC